MPTNLRSDITAIARKFRQQLDRATKESAEAVRDRAKANVARDEGELMNAIHVERRGMAEFSVVAGNDEAWYGHIIEHGATGVGRPRKDEGGMTRQERRDTRRVAGTGSLPPRPFLVPALEAERLRIEQRVEEALRDIEGIER